MVWSVGVDFTTVWLGTFFDARIFWWELSVQLTDEVGYLQICALFGCGNCRVFVYSVSTLDVVWRKLDFNQLIK